MHDEITPEQMFNKMMEQQNRMKPPEINVGQSNTILGSDLPNASEQVVINSIRNQTIPVVDTSQGKCYECGMIHPSTGGKPCPNASIQLNTGKKIDDAKVNTYLVQWRNIIFAHIQKAGIEDWNKIFQEATILFAQTFNGEKK